MEILEKIDIKTSLRSAIKNSQSYDDYKCLMQKLTDNNATTGNQKSDSLIEFTKLNNRRMIRWEKTLKLEGSSIKKIKEYNKNSYWLVITESWCGDAAHVIPVLNKIAQQNDRIDIKMVLRDENEQLMNLFLTNGSKSIPKLIAIDKDKLEVLFTYGPRPSAASIIVENEKKENGILSLKFKQELQMWYNKDKGKTTVADIIELMQA